MPKVAPEPRRHAAPSDSPVAAAVVFSAAHRFRDVIAPSGMQPWKVAVLRQVDPTRAAGAGEGFEAAARNEQTVFGSLSDTDRAKLRRLLQAVADSLGLEPGQLPGTSQDWRVH